MKEHDKEQILVLFELLPTETYLERAALAVARLAGGSGAAARVHSTEVQVGVAARHSRRVEIEGGELSVWSDELIDDDAERALRFGVELLARGLRLSDRMASQSALLDARLSAAPLGPRERELCRHLAAGATTAQLAERMDLTESSVRTYVKRILAKMNVRSRLELVARLTDR